MLAFLDFEASSLSERSYPIEVAWVFEDGASRSFLIRPAPEWTDWGERAEQIHGIARATLLAEGVPHDEVARTMVAELTGHDLVATAPSWDGKWLSALLRAAGLPRRSLRLRDSDEALRECAVTILSPVLPPEDLAEAVANLLAIVDIREADHAPTHRALADAQDMRDHWLAIRDAARAMVDSAG